MTKKKKYFGGSIDTFFKENLNTSETVSLRSSFANLPEFSQEMIDLVGSYEVEKVRFTTDLVFGPGGVDAVFDLSQKFYLGINKAYFDNDGTGFTGFALYSQLEISDSLRTGLRGKCLKENGDFATIGTRFENSIIFTITSENYTVDDLTTIPENRFNSSSDDFFFHSDLTIQSSLSLFFTSSYL